MNDSKAYLIDELNGYYCSLNKELSDINWQTGQIQELDSKLSSFTREEYIDRFIRITTDSEHKLKYCNDDSLSAIVSVAQKYAQHIIDIRNYGQYLADCSVSSFKTLKTDNSNLNALKQSRSEFDMSKKQLGEKHGLHLSVETDICSAYSSIISQKKGQLIREIERVLEEARNSFSEEWSLDIRSNDKYLNVETLPEAMLIAKCPSEDKPCELMVDINRDVSYKDIFVNLKEQGNVLVETDYAHTLDKELDQFVLAYIFRFIDMFPIGMANVHIFDRNPNRYNQRLSNIFKDGSYSERTKKVISLHDYSTLSELKDVSSVIIEDTFKKFSYEHKDLYSVYEIDKTSPFTLIVLRDGLLDQSGYSASNILEIINSLTTPSESGHLCGIRFLIIDDSSSKGTNGNDNTSFLIDSIKNNCSTKLEYKNKEFVYQDKCVDVLSIKDDLDEFIQIRATGLADRITGLEKQYVSVSDLSVTDQKNPNDSIYRIPIGKAGNDVTEIPLSCRDDNGTVDGQCIGYMVIGQSGSGKSSFFHSVVINGCLQYSPADLQFWLLDFKYGGASSKYKKSKIPHVRIVSENNKIDDALCLFQMIYDEMERRNKLINSLSVDNIVDYNALVDKSSRLPRIVVMIDEVQEIFRDDNASEIQKMISGISVRMRSVGMHFIMVAQNLSEGKSYMLKEAFLPSATGRICFRVSENMPRDSGFDESFIQRKSEITTLSTGEAYVSWGKDTIRRVKMAYASPEDMNNQLFNAIIAKYPNYADLKPMVIGSKQRLSINGLVQTSNLTYSQVLNKLSCGTNGFNVVVGEDAYRLSPLEFSFSPYEMSSLLVLGEDKNMASSICASITLSLVKQNATVHLFNADRQKGQYGDSVLPHPFMHLCSQLKTNLSWMVPHSLNDFCAVVADLYSEYLSRVNTVQMSEDEDVPAFDSIFLIVNDLFGIKSFQTNERINVADRQNESHSSMSSGFDFSLIDQELNKRGSNDSFNESIQSVVEKLFKDGYNYNIFLVLALKGDPGIWRNIRASEVNNIVMFNSTQYVNQVENQFFIREMLKNISSDNGDETLAIWINKKRISKMRPILYDMSNEKEVGEMNSMMGV